MMMFVSMLARDIGVCPATRASRMQGCLPRCLLRCLIRGVCACGRSVAAFPSLVRTWYNELDRSTATRVDKFVAAAISPVCLQPWIPNPAVYIHTLLLEHTSVCPVFRISGFGFRVSGLESGTVGAIGPVRCARARARVSPGFATAVAGGRWRHAH